MICWVPFCSHFRSMVEGTNVTQGPSPVALLALKRSNTHNPTNRLKSCLIPLSATHEAPGGSTSGKQVNCPGGPLATPVDPGRQLARNLHPIGFISKLGTLSRQPQEIRYRERCKRVVELQRGRWRKEKFGSDT